MANQKTAQELGLIPIQYECPHCGEIYEQGLVRAKVWPVQKGWLCPKCWETLKKITVTRTIYENGFVEVSGECTVCGQFPCRHANPSGQFVGAVTGKPFGENPDPFEVGPFVRKRWLMGDQKTSQRKVKAK